MVSKLNSSCPAVTKTFCKNRKLDCLFVVIGVIPLVFIIYLVYKYHVDVPYADQWYLVPLINKFFEGTLTFSDLWAQFGDHRMFFPKIIWLMLIEVSSWNTFYETSLNVFLFVVLYTIILVQIRQSLSLIGKGSVWLFFPIVSLIMFSTKNWENWLCGLQITYSLNFLCAVSGLLLLCEPRHKIGCLVGSFLLGFVATHSFSFGLAYWPVGFIPLIFWRGANRPLRRWFLLAWAVFSVIGYLSFFYGYSRATDPAQSKFYADRFYDVVLFTLSLFGSPLGRLFDVIHFPGNRTFLGFFHLFHPVLSLGLCNQSVHQGTPRHYTAFPLYYSLCFSERTSDCCRPVRYWYRARFLGSILDIS